MKKIVLLFIFLLMISCEKDDGKLDFIIVQVNDVYEIDALEGGKSGGMARVANLYNELKAENPNTLLVHAGDFLNPSLLGTLRDENGQRYRGKQMIDVMNAMEFDLVAFGNHEFDLPYNDLQKRLNESTFQWIGTNIKFKNDSITTPFYVEKDSVKTTIPKTVTFDFKDVDGTILNVGFFSATINSNPKAYVDYGDLYQDAINAYNSLKSTSDVVLGLTHLSISQDKLIANSLPNVPLILGGHEHNNMLVPVGDALISKADANAKTAYVHTITFDKKTKQTTIDSELVLINNSIEEDETIATVIQKWNEVLDEKLKVVIDNPYEVIYTSAIPLDGRDTQIRSEQTNLGKIIAASMSYAYNDYVDCAIVHGGSIRIDDRLQGEITGVDIFRVLPFGGGIYKVEMTGELLEKSLQYSRLKAGTGAYLQLHNTSYDINTKSWKVAGNSILKNKIYTVAVPDYLLLGYDIPFLKRGVKGLKKVYENPENHPGNDIRKVVINYFNTL